MSLRGFSLEDTRRQVRSEQAVVEQTLGSFAGIMADDYPSFEGVVCYTRDTYYPDADVIARANRQGLTKKLGKFQQENIAGRRVDLATTTVGMTFADKQTDDGLSPSRMNPNQHSVFGLYLPQSQSVAQLAFTNDMLTRRHTPNIDTIMRGFARFQEPLEASLGHISLISQDYLTGSAADLLKHGMPITSDTALVGWDISGSTEFSAADYPELRAYLHEQGSDIRNIVEAHPTGHFLSETDGQLYRIDIPPAYNPNIKRELGQFVVDILEPILEEIAGYLRGVDRLRELSGDVRYPVRIAAEVGRIEKMPSGYNGPVFWELQKLSKDLPREDRVALALGPRASAATHVIRRNRFIL